MIPHFDTYLVYIPGIPTPMESTADCPETAAEDVCYRLGMHELPEGTSITSESAPRDYPCSSAT